MVAFALKFPGDIRAFKTALWTSIIAQKLAFLDQLQVWQNVVLFKNALPAGSSAEKEFIATSSGNGTVLEFDGHIKEYELAPDIYCRLIPGYLVG